MKRLFITIAVLVMFLPAIMQGAMSNPAANIISMMNEHANQSTDINPVYKFANEVETWIESNREIKGTIYYVDSGVSGGDGTTWAAAKATLDAAIGECTANDGDVIYVAPGHAETIGTVAVDIAGITIIGLGVGSDMPTLTYDGTGDEIVVSVASVYISGLRLVAGVSGITNAFDMQAGSDYSVVAGCEFPEPGNAAYEFTNVFQMVTGADNVTIAYNTWINQAGSPGSNNFIDGGAAAIDSLSVVGNYINADAAVAALMFSDQADTNLLIEGNTVIQEDIDKWCLELTSTATGIIKNNSWANLGGATFFMDPGTCHVEGNTGDPVMDAAAGHGNTWYLDDGGSNGDGLSWETAKTTLTAAEALCIAGDTILVGQLHNQAMGAAETINVAGVTIIGMGEGDERPSFDYDSAATELTISAAGITIRNIRLIPSTSETVAAIVVGATGLGCVLDGVVFEVGEASGDEFIDGIVVNAAAEGLIVKNCVAVNPLATSGAQDTFLNLDDTTVDDCTAINNTIFGDYAEAPIWWGADIPVNVHLEGNTITNVLTAQACIEGSGAATGVCLNNNLSADTYGAVLLPGNMRCIGNKQTVVVAAGAEDVPLIAGKTYSRAMLLGDMNATQNLFSVTGSPIIVTSFVGKATIACGGATTMKIFVDADDTFDYDISTSVDVDTVDAGGLLTFTAAAGESVLAIQAVGASGSMGVPLQWWVEEGMMSATLDGGGSTGNMEWYMVFQPVESGGEVVPQATN